MSQFILDVLKEVLSSPLILMLVGTLLGSLVANKAHEKKLKSASDSERRKHLRSILAKILSHQSRLMDRQFEIYNSFVNLCEDKEEGTAARDDQDKLYEKAIDSVRPINDAIHELIAELHILTDIPNDLYDAIAFRCGTGNFTNLLEDTIKKNQKEESYKHTPTELEKCTLYLDTFQSIRKPWLKSLLDAIQAVLKHTEK